MPAAMVWIHIIDRHPSLHGVLTGLLTAIGAIGILIVLSIPPTWTPFILPAAIISCILDGSFFQPLEVVIDSAIIKILGDYKILYAKERNWGKFTLAIVTFAIGCFLEGDHDFDTLMVVLLIGSVALFLLSLSTSVQAVDPALLVGRQHQPLLTTEIIYKPYHVFGEHLSHISEEDASMLQRMATTHSKYTSIIDQYASFDLVRLPHPPASSASIVLMSSLKISCSHEEDAQEKRVARSMQISFLCLGIVRGMTQSVIYLFLYDKLKMPTYIIGAVGSMEIFSSLLADRLLIHVIEHVTHLWIATCSAYTLSLLSTVVYIYLTMNTILIQVSVIILQLCQGMYMCVYMQP
ncbi:hypothetical protein RMATCC62417_09266 [Rhizopus microsporus]|nr:hypothetical protein RMATCC62417_09266 [Rhizopus microsporus]